MKALEILESLQLAIFDAHIKETSIKFSSKMIDEIQEALDELEALQEENEHLKNMLQAHTKEK